MYGHIIQENLEKINIYESTSYDYIINIRNRDNTGMKIFGEVFIKNTPNVEKYTITKSYLEAPTHLIATGGNARCELKWDEVEGATGYNVKRSQIENGPYAVVANQVTGDTYTDQTATNGLTYYYVITAVNSEGESSKSNEVKVRISATKILNRRSL